MRHALLLSLTLTLCACGGGETAAEETEQTPSSGGESTASAEPMPAWADLAPEDRGRYMAEVVVPRMRPLFQALDAEEFADFGCATCHGENAREVHFEMPNGIAPLDPAAIPSLFESEEGHDARFAQAMANEITPAMVELLGAQAYDPATHEGFGCFGCHGMAE